MIKEGAIISTIPKGLHGSSLLGSEHAETIQTGPLALPRTAATRNAEAESKTTPSSTVTSVLSVIIDVSSNFS